MQRAAGVAESRKRQCSEASGNPVQHIVQFGGKTAEQRQRMMALWFAENPVEQQGQQRRECAQHHCSLSCSVTTSPMMVSVGAETFSLATL